MIFLLVGFFSIPFLIPCSFSDQVNINLTPHGETLDECNSLFEHTLQGILMRTTVLDNFGSCTQARLGEWADVRLKAGRSVSQPF